MKNLKISAFLCLFLGTLSALAVTHEEEHDKHEEQEQHEHEEHGHEHEAEHAHEARNNVGPDKAVLFADEALGFILQTDVESRLGLKAESLERKAPWQVPKSAILYSQEEYQVFRRRDGFWKAVDVSLTKRSSLILIQSKDLKPGDFIATEGNGLLKIVELSVFGPAIEGHVH